MSEKWFGSVYETVGSTSSDLLLKTRGQVKVQIGNKFVDLLKDDSNESIFHNVKSTDDIDKNGIYLVENDIFIKIGDKIVQITQSTNK